VAEHPNPKKLKIMKQILAAISISVVWAFASFAIAQQEKTDSKTSSQASAKAAASAEHKIVAPSDLQWGDAPPSLPAGAKATILEGDPAKKGSFTIRLQMPAGYKVPPHTHPTAEHITVISGSFHLAMGDKLDEASGHDMPAGSFAIMPAGMKHTAWATAETVVQVHGMGPFEIKYLKPSDDPRNAKK
jgi:quercetin dioxygenase-like cupin family protein